MKADGAADVQHDHEGQPERLGIRLCRHHRVPTEQGGEQNRVTEARDGEQFAQTLEHAQEDGLEHADRMMARGVGHRQGEDMCAMLGKRCWRMARQRWHATALRETGGGGATLRTAAWPHNDPSRENIYGLFTLFTGRSAILPSLLPASS